ncbi:Crp/Fnr family transcriptional regulator [Congregibacter variabilis]|uniref:Crp/Fnr family transcriptional regulator n=1 Tax=Congregibacter variabilis TaxID=3081200 RepID=A0ABZ0I6J8_9GAMM|nr:Crp/Fnr family transcriptional regulator [Congregibacter sp. IMCC43200]
MITVPHLHDFIEQLPDALRGELVLQARQRKIDRGDAVYHQGDEPNEWYQIVSGAVKLCSYSNEGNELVAVELQQGDCFGEMGVIDSLPRISNAIAARDCIIRVWTRADFESFNRQFPAFNTAVMQVLARRARLAYCVWLETSGLSLRERIGIALCRLAHTLVTDPTETDIPISQEGLGNMLGASRQSVNKELQQLAAAQLISLRYGKIRVIDLEQLTNSYGVLVGTDSIVATYQVPTAGVSRAID